MPLSSPKLNICNFFNNNANRLPASFGIYNDFYFIYNGKKLSMHVFTRNTGSKNQIQLTNARKKVILKRSM